MGGQGPGVGPKSSKLQSHMHRRAAIGLPVLARPLLKNRSADRVPSRVRPGAISNQPLTQPSASVMRALVSLQPRPESIMESEGHVNKKILVSAAAVCFLTHVLTVQGMLLTAYLAAATAVPVGAVNHAIKKRNALPALFILLPLLIVPHIGFLRVIYMNVVNPVSVQIKAKITLPALIHAFVGSKHPALRAGLKSAQVVSQVVLLILLLQYLFAPKIADAMRQRAIMLCRAFTTTESQGMNVRNGEATLETWPNKQVDTRQPKDGPESFLRSISRGDPQKWDSCLAGNGGDFERLGKLRDTIFRNLPQGEQPTITDAYSHTEATGSQYSFVGARRDNASTEQADTAGDGTAASARSSYDDADAEYASMQSQLKDLGLRFESETTDEKEAAGISADLDAVVDSISSPEELFEVLNEQLNMVQSLADKLRTNGVALKQSEQAREDLVRELEATVGEKKQLGQELNVLSLKFEAAQSMWERHLEQEGSFSDFVTEEVLEKVVEALTERNRGLAVSFMESDDDSYNVVDGDALAAKFRLPSDSSKGDGASQNNAQPFNRVSAIIGQEMTNA